MINKEKSDINNTSSSTGTVASTRENNNSKSSTVMNIWLMSKKIKK
jgi:hypothetical protein